MTQTDIQQPEPAAAAPEKATPLNAKSISRRIKLTYLAGLFPARSETFVYREVRRLREIGWDVEAVSLNDSADTTQPELADLCRDRIVVYGSGQKETLLGLLRESVRHPLATIRTKWFAVRDAVYPGEPMPLTARLKLLGQALAGIGLAGRLRPHGTRHIHCHFAHAPTTVGMYAAKQLGIPFSFTGHANDLFQRRSLLKRKLLRTAFVACISKWHREFYEAISGKTPAVFAVVRCGVDVHSWNPHPVQNDSTKPIQILTVCRLVEKKGCDVLLESLAKIDTSKSPQWRLTIAGDGPQRAQLEQQARQLGIADRVEFQGAVTNEHVRDLLNGADLFVLACREDSAGDRDGIPVVLMEAMACGVPVISGDLPAIRELVHTEKSGLLVNGADAVLVQQAITRLIGDPALRSRFAAAARLTVEKDFDLEENVHRLERLFSAAGKSK